MINALLPMKSHSARVPNKNIRLFHDKPLYYHIAYVLQESKLVSLIIINTDSDVIAEEASKCFSKVKIINRPPELCGDFVSMNDIIAHDINSVEGEHFLQTHCTNPLLTQTTIEQAINVYFNSLDKHDSLFSVNKLQTRLYWESGEPINHNPGELLRTQDLPPVYEENSNIYLFSKNSFIAAGNNRIGINPKMFQIPHLESIDIDEEHDFQIAQQIMRLRVSGDIV